jgi:hypothetical protein
MWERRGGSPVGDRPLRLAQDCWKESTFSCLFFLYLGVKIRLPEGPGRQFCSVLQPGRMADLKLGCGSVAEGHG